MASSAQLACTVTLQLFYSVLTVLFYVKLYTNGSMIRLCISGIVMLVGGGVRVTT